MPAQKLDLLTSFGVAQNVLDWHKMYLNFWTGTKHFGTRRRTRHKILGGASEEETRNEYENP